jgi:uncharacterized protein (DUF1684 family)
MRNRDFVFFLFFVIVLCCLCGSSVSIAGAQTFYGSTDLKTFRDGRDHEMRDPNKTPLPKAEIEKFSGLKYYDANRKFRVRARLRKEPSEQKVQFQTSSGKIRTFLKYGVVSFKLSGKKFELNVYQTEPGAQIEEYKNLLFVPFRDLTSGKESYGTGRYIDIRIPEKDKVILDFNLAYNPNCAYGSGQYNCPVPPKENRLDIEITAGEKSYLTGH